MGCTSSAPKMAKPKGNSGVNPVPEDHRSEVAKDTSKDIETDFKLETETNVANVLPNMCDNLVEPTHLDRNNKYFDAPKPDNNEKDLQSSGRIEIDHKINMNDKNETVSYSTEDKLSTMEEVVDKVVEMYITDSGIESSNVVQGSTDDANVAEDSGINKTKKYIEHQTNESDSIETKEDQPTAAAAAAAAEEAEGVVSPSQSQGSRATRWEALADVAAELPPSLAVDPLTGQIYALSK